MPTRTAGARRSVGVVASAAAAALLLTACTGGQEDPMSQDSVSPTGAGAPTSQQPGTTEAPAPDATTGGPDDAGATTAPATTAPPAEVDLAAVISDEDLLEQTRWALGLLEEETGVVSAGEFAERFDQAFQDQLSAFELSVGIGPLRLSGPYTVTHAAVGAGRVASLSLHSERRPLILSIGLDDEGRIQMLSYQEDTSGEPPAISAWADLDAALADLGAQTQVVVGEVRDGTCQTVHTTEGLPAGGEARPTGSVFKLLVLAGLVDAVEAGELAWADELEITDAVKSLPSGILQDRETGSTVSVQEAAELMISISDNTATDLLIAAVGQDRLRSSAEQAGVDPDRVTPLQTTRELFILGWGVEQDVRDRWARAASHQERQAVLEGLPQDLSVVDVDAVTTPVWQDGVDWPLTGGEVCSMHARLQQQAATEAGGPVREILSANPGGQVPESVTYQGFKGGSAPGVLALSYYVETGAAAQDAPEGYVLVLQTRSESMIDQLRMGTIVGAGLQHLAGGED
ncbi:serine hydrolase [Ornithinimicrobium pratense]|uniref:Serine hydrolase n=1 Tax=Ornithinimicrobium pratense TaxID=2593973 RepID=A0A5J6V8A4_9MICO|nr:serine hydrolase [Ornithinimicrobium pratense]QFG69381.1 serine hydrolase [Ornithinimicrobium pratense]